MATVSATNKNISSSTDFLPLEGTDYIEFYVGNAKQAAHYYITAFGFQPLAYAGPETGMKDKASYAVRQHKLTFVLTTPLRPGSPMANHIYKHGDGVKALSLRVADAASAWEETTKRGAKSYMEPQRLRDENGELVMSGIHTYGDTIHLFIERKNYSGAFMPGYQPWSKPHLKTADTGLLYVVCADEQSDEQWQWFCQVSHQRTGRRKEKIAGGRIPGVLPGRRRATCGAGY
jgi:4-hydroxyphenylpyruvate dioxygenase